MDRDVGSKHVCSVPSHTVQHQPLSPCQIVCGPTLELSRGEALILVLIFSLGLWVALWAALSLLARCGLR